MDPVTTEQRIALALVGLPTLPASAVPPDDACPICLVPFAAIQLSGVTMLDGCGHVFCRAEVDSGQSKSRLPLAATCPACRHAFLDLSDSDNESSDGDYVPDDDDDSDIDDADDDDDIDIDPGPIASEAFIDIGDDADGDDSEPTVSDANMTADDPIHPPLRTLDTAEQDVPRSSAVLGRKGPRM